MRCLPRARHFRITELARLGHGVSAAILLATLLGCASRQAAQPANVRPFNFETDTFAYANELVWEYFFNDEGKWQHRRHDPPPDYTHRCFVMARSARQFFQHARFAPEEPPASETEYRQLVGEVVGRDPARDGRDEERVVIPGYSNLRTFSGAQEPLLKSECGGVWQSYSQRGHWRMIFPFGRRHQERTADALIAAIQANRPPVIHLVRFPKITINHGMLVFGFEETTQAIRYFCYDPNDPNEPAVLTFDRDTRWFSLPTNDYFEGGRVNAYEIYRSWNY